MRLSIRKALVTTKLCNGILTHGVKAVDQQVLLDLIKTESVFIDEEDNKSGEYLYLTPFFISTVLANRFPEGLVAKFRTFKKPDEKISICHKTDIETASEELIPSHELLLESSLIDLLRKSDFTVSGKSEKFSFAYTGYVVIDHSDDEGRIRLGIPYFMVSDDIKIIAGPDGCTDLGYNGGKFIQENHFRQLDTWSRLMVNKYMTDQKEYHKQKGNTH